MITDRDEDDVPQFSQLIDRIIGDIAANLGIPSNLLTETYSPVQRVSISDIVRPRFPKLQLTRSEKIAEAWREYRMGQPNLILDIDEGPWLLQIGEEEHLSFFMSVFEEAEFRVVRYGEHTVVEADGVIVERLTKS